MIAIQTATVDDLESLAQLFEELSGEEACPAGAIKGAKWEDHPQTREDALYFTRCVEKVTEDFAKRPEIGKSICGVCISVCPWGKSK